MAAAMTGRTFLGGGLLLACGEWREPLCEVRVRPVRTRFIVEIVLLGDSPLGSDGVPVCGKVYQHRGCSLDELPRLVTRYQEDAERLNFRYGKPL